MRDWPPITEPELLERLAMDNDMFFAFFRQYVGVWGVREYTPEVLAHGLAYPWERPAHSYLLRGDDVQLLEDLEPEQRTRTVASLTSERHPLVAFGSNAAPERLELKFAHFPDKVDREVLVLTGDLHDFDVGAAASVAPYGALPATLFASPGTAVRSAVLWLTAAQVTQLTWSEVPYRLGRLDTARFVVDDGLVEIDQVLVFIHRLGTFCVDDEPIALAAVPADRRSSPAWTQQQLMDEVAHRVLGPEAGAADLVRKVHEDISPVFEAVAEHVWPSGRALPADLWTPYPTP